MGPGELSSWVAALALTNCLRTASHLPTWMATISMMVRSSMNNRSLPWRFTARNWRAACTLAGLPLIQCTLRGSMDICPVLWASFSWLPTSSKELSNESRPPKRFWLQVHWWLGSAENRGEIVEFSLRIHCWTTDLSQSDCGRCRIACCIYARWRFTGPTPHVHRGRGRGRFLGRRPPPETGSVRGEPDLGESGGADRSQPVRSPRSLSGVDWPGSGAAH